MPFKTSPQKFNAAINTVEIGSGDKKIVLGGESVYPFYSFDAPIENKPVVGVEISDLGLENAIAGIAEYYAGATTMAEIAAKAAAMPGASFVALTFDGADPIGANKTAEECAAVAKEVAEAIDLPLVVCGCGNNEKDVELFNAVSAALEGKNILVMSAKEDTYKTVAASAGLAYGHKVGAESAVDINLAKQLNVIIGQVGVNAANIVMNVGTAAAGYGFEYVVSAMDRIEAAALSQNDAMLQMPIMTPVGSQAWAVKESLVSEADMPEWGPQDDRGVNMEICTAVAALASGSNAVILRHPKSVATVANLIDALM
ncbi:MAG: acetyl-CoA decarbonylase/synthase complex subunit delta [Anaerofustis stercorihominis]|nr:acetyl-CoA decarbonylase/synthase complex subunit delta [Anaerofustis stercorihominis]